MSIRAERVQTAAALRAKGLTLREIGMRMGIDFRTVHEYLTDPDGEKMRARKASYRGVCVDCGTQTNGSDGRGPNAPKRCRKCAQVYTTELARDRWRPYRERIEALWAEGRTARQIVAALGLTGTYSQVGFIRRCRDRGYNLPYRRTAEARERIRAATDGMAAARAARRKVAA